MSRLMQVNEIHALYDKHDKVSSFPKSHQNTLSSVKYELTWKSRMTLCDVHPERAWIPLVSFAAARAGVTERSPSPRGCFKPTYIPFSVFCAFVCSDQWASRLVVIVYAAPITGANIRKQMKATHWLVYFRERNVCRFEAAAWGRGALRDSGPSGCEGD